MIEDGQELLKDAVISTVGFFWHTKYSVKYNTHLKECAATGWAEYGGQVHRAGERAVFGLSSWAGRTAAQTVLNENPTAGKVAATITFSAAPSGREQVPFDLGGLQHV